MGQYAAPDLALSHSIAGIGVLRVLFGVDLGLVLWHVEVLPLKINSGVGNGAVRSSLDFIMWVVCYIGKGSSAFQFFLSRPETSISGENPCFPISGGHVHPPTTKT